MGHAYEGVTADIITRYHRLTLPSGYFLTGSDEHGQKIAGVAEEAGVAPIDITDKYVTGFQVLNQRQLVCSDDYMRTTSDRHKATCKALWNKCSAAGDIFLDKYEGWYNIREETFVTESDALLSNYCDPATNLPLKKVSEESYFFRMSKYQERLKDHIESNPDFIQPEFQRQFILKRLAEPLRDLSISRTTFKWGIPVPEGFAPDHVMYVWFDALTNYMSGVNTLGAFDSNTPDYPDNLQDMWPADCHLIGKDILWFHTVIWPCMLMSAGLPLFKTCFAHGFINDKEGKKMSKSIGNVIDPHDMLDKYPVDSFRWYLAKETTFGGELSFSEESLIQMHNSDMNDTLGNLVHRATNLCGKFCNGVVPDVAVSDSLPFDLEALRSSADTAMRSFQLERVADQAIATFRDINKYLTEAAPWLLKGDENDVARKVAIRTTLEAIYAAAHYLVPFIPSAAGEIFNRLGTEPVCYEELNANLLNLTPGTVVAVGDILFTKIQSDEERSAAEAKEKKAADLAAAQAKKKAAKEAANKKAMDNNDRGGGDEDANQPDFTKVEIRVGKITKVWNHESADKLFCEEIEVGEEAPRQIASGLRGHYELADMQDRLVLVVCNLKAAKIVGFASAGMVLAAKSGDAVELVDPPAGSVVGERVFIDGMTGEPLSSQQMKKKKTWDVVAKDLKTNAGFEATWSGGVIKTSAGVCTVKSCAEAPIS
jgi:methionyl-tRNA synthetase